MFCQHLQIERFHMKCRFWLLLKSRSSSNSWGCSWVAAPTVGEACPLQDPILYLLFSFKMSASFVYITCLLPLACDFATLVFWFQGIVMCIFPEKGLGTGPLHLRAGSTCRPRNKTGDRISLLFPNGLLQAWLYFLALNGKKNIEPHPIRLYRSLINSSFYNLGTCTSGLQGIFPGPLYCFLKLICWEWVCPW